MANFQINKITGLAVLLIYVLSFSSCGNTAAKNKANEVATDNAHKTRHINFIILLDLSDRILDPEQIDRDKRIINLIYERFENEVRNDIYINSKDKITVEIAPQKSPYISCEKHKDALYINMASLKLADKKPKEEERKNKFFTSINELYKEAIVGAPNVNYTGADIWKWFKDDLKVDSGYENFLFILTDGYMNIEGLQDEYIDTLQSIGKKFPNLNVAVMEVTPKEEDFAYERLYNLWGTWFSDMGITNFRLFKKDGLTKTQELVQGFIKNPTPERESSNITSAKFDRKEEMDNRVDKNIGYIMVADNRLHRSGYAWRIKKQNKKISPSLSPKNIEVTKDGSYVIMYKMNLRRELPPNDESYYTEIPVNRVLYRSDKVILLEKPKAVKRRVYTQYWAKVKFIE